MRLAKRVLVCFPAGLKRSQTETLCVSFLGGWSACGGWGGGLCRYSGVCPGCLDALARGRALVTVSLGALGRSGAGTMRMSGGIGQRRWCCGGAACLQCGACCGVMECGRYDRSCRCCGCVSDAAMGCGWLSGRAAERGKGRGKGEEEEEEEEQQQQQVSNSDDE